MLPAIVLAGLLGVVPAGSSSPVPFAAPNGTATFDELILFDATAPPPDLEVAFARAAARRFDVASALSEAASDDPERRERGRELLRDGVARHVTYTGGRYRADELNEQRATIMRCDTRETFDLDLAERYAIPRRFDFFGVMSSLGQLKMRSGDDIASSGTGLLTGVRGRSGSYRFDVTLNLQGTASTSGFTFAFDRPIEAPGCPALDRSLFGIGLEGLRVTLAQMRELLHAFNVVFEEHVTAPPATLPTRVDFDLAFPVARRGVVARLHVEPGAADEAAFAIPPSFATPESRTRDARVSLLAGGFPRGTIAAIVPEPDGALLYVTTSGVVGRIDAHGLPHEIANVPASVPAEAAARAADGALWFVDTRVRAVVRVAPSGGVQTFALGLRDDSRPARIGTAGRDAIIVTEGQTGDVVRIDPAGRTRFVASAAEIGLPDRENVAFRPDGTVVIPHLAGGGILVVSPTGALSHLPVPGLVGRVALAGDGTIWCTSGTGIAHLSAAGGISTVPLPADKIGPHAFGGLAVGRDGTVWALYSPYDGSDEHHGLVRITPGGATSFIPFPSSAAGQLTVASDGTLVFSDEMGSQIRRKIP